MTQLACDALMRCGVQKLVPACCRQSHMLFFGMCDQQFKSCLYAFGTTQIVSTLGSVVYLAAAAVTQLACDALMLWH